MHLMKWNKGGVIGSVEIFFFLPSFSTEIVLAFRRTISVKKRRKVDFPEGHKKATVYI
jgi:hypothetical protein